MGFCLTKDKSLELKRKIKNGELDPQKLAEMTSEQRHAWFAKFLGEDNAFQVNALLERKLLLKNYKLGLINGIKQLTGMTPQVRQDLITRIGKMDKILNPADEKMFMKDLANKALKLDFSQEEAKTISDLSRKMQDLKTKADAEGKFPTEKDRLDYGMSNVLLKKYIDDLKLESRKIGFKEQPVKYVANALAEIPGIMKSAIASFDNSFWGRQGIKTFWDFKTSKYWVKNFLQSWRDIGNQLKAKGKIWTSGDDAVMDSIKADIISRPNAVNGKYKAGGYGLDVMNEEAFPTSIPEKIPLLGRVFKASETAYSGGALRLRADLADRMIKIAEENGINTLDPKQAKGLGNMISSLTGRGSLGKGEVFAKEANVLLFSVKFLKANIDTLIAPLREVSERIGLTKAATEGERFAIKQSANSTLRIIGTMATVLTLAELLSPGSTDNDPRSTNFGKVKIFGHWTDISGGMASLLTLASRLIPTVHDGKKSYWKKDANGKWTDLGSGKFGMPTPWDILFGDTGFLGGKLSPFAGIIKDKWAGKDFNGQVPTLENIIKGNITPLSIQTYEQLQKDPASSFVFGSMLLDALGFSVSSNIAPNTQTKLIPEGKNIKNEDLITGIQVYAQAMGTDPETAFNRIFTGQKITRVSNGTIIVERMPLAGSQAIKKKAGANNPSMKLDHTVPLELGGSNDTSNLKLVTTSEWSSYTPVENALGTALKAGKITKQQAQEWITQFKNKKLTKEQVLGQIPK